MTEQDRGFAPTDPSIEDDLLAPEPHEESSTEESGAEPHGCRRRAEGGGRSDGAGGPEDAQETEGKARSRSSSRQLVRIGWVAIVVVAVIGALVVVELVRVSSALSTNNCVQEAQAHFMQALGPGVSQQYAALDRLTGQNQLNKC